MAWKDSVESESFMTEKEGISILPSTEGHLEGLRRCIDAVARERHFIAVVEGPPLPQIQEFVRGLIAGGGIQLVAVDDAGNVVGWCDIMRYRTEGFRHCGRLGMGLLPAMRGRGLGRRLAEAAIQAAFAGGMERIELEVFASNESAIALYDRLGFVREGLKRNARKLDGVYDDSVLMVLARESWNEPGALGA
jgi:RimJ/RimL family protein N-acetyltransferase